MSKVLLAAMMCIAVAARAGGMFAAFFSRDLDGDGRDEAVSFQADSDHMGGACCSFAITVDGVRYPHHGVGIVRPAFVVDIDSTDTYHEIAVEEYGPSDDDATYLFRYDHGALVEIGELPGRQRNGVGDLVIDGSGVITGRCRGNLLQTWFYPCRFQVGTDGRLEQEREQWHPVRTPLTVLQPIDLRAAPDDGRVVARLRPGDKVTLVASDDERWSMIEFADGQRGWFEVSNIDILPDGRRAGEVFEGFVIAD